MKGFRSSSSHWSKYKLKIYYIIFYYYFSGVTKQQSSKDSNEKESSDEVKSEVINDYIMNRDI